LCLDDLFIGIGTDLDDAFVVAVAGFRDTQDVLSGRNVDPGRFRVMTEA